MTTSLTIRRGQYRDSVALMQLSRDLGALAGVRAAFVAMATPLNLELLPTLGFDQPVDAAPNDMVVALDALDAQSLAEATTLLEELLQAKVAATTGSAAGEAHRTVRSAARHAPDATVALLSVPGDAVLAEAMDALDAGLSVMIFSDNVPVEDEVALKDDARARGLMVMGPDCGTAVLHGVGLGFANVVRPGVVSLVAASGTGAQHLMCLLDAAGVGVRHCLGVGGRDLSASVGGRSTLQALDMLAADVDTEIVVVVSKPAAPGVAERVTQRAADLGKPVILAVLAPGEPDLTAVAARVAAAQGRAWVEPRWWPAPPSAAAVPTSAAAAMPVTTAGMRADVAVPTKQPAAAATPGTFAEMSAAGVGSAAPHLRGLYVGGTLCYEAMLIASAALGPVASNIPLDPGWSLPPDLRSPGHLMIDFGADELTRGRPHPMIDPGLRLARIEVEAADPSCGVLLLDVVLGHAAHPDPAAELAPVIHAARQRAAGGGRDLAVVVALIGTADDPQGLARQAEALNAAGASVHLSNAAAARHAVALLGDLDPTGSRADRRQS